MRLWYLTNVIKTSKTLYCINALRLIKSVYFHYRKFEYSMLCLPKLILEPFHENVVLKQKYPSSHLLACIHSYIVPSDK